MGRLAYKSAVGFSAVTSVECIYSRFPSWKPEEYVGSVKEGDGEGSKQEMQTKGNC